MLEGTIELKGQPKDRAGTTYYDDFGRPYSVEMDRRTIFDLFPPNWPRVHHVGRLDKDTTGLLLMTDDGGLIHRWTSPKHHVPKVYEVQTARPVEPGQVQRLLDGVVLDDDPKPVRAEGCEATGDHALRLTLVQGKYHQVKRMVAAVGNHCEGLHRSAFGVVTLEDGPAGGLAPGQWRWVQAAERAALTARAAAPKLSAAAPPR